MSNRATKTPTKASRPKEPRVSCRVPRRLIVRLGKIARANGMDISDVVRMSLYRVLPEYEKREAA